MPSWMRSVPWGLSLLPVVNWWTAFVIEIGKVLGGGTWQDNVEEIFFAYVIWLNIPLSAASTTYIVLLPLLTDDLSPSDDDDEDDSDHEDDEDDDDSSDAKGDDSDEDASEDD